MANPDRVLTSDAPSPLHSPTLSPLHSYAPSPPLSPTPEPLSPPHSSTTSASPIATPPPVASSSAASPPVNSSFDSPQHRVPEAAHQGDLPAYSTYSPATSPSAQHFLAPNAGAIYKEHQLPSVLNVLDETDLLGLSFAWESRHIVELEVQLAERRYRQMILKARTHQLDAFRAHERMRNVIKSADFTLETALKQSAYLQGVSSQS